MKGGAPPGAANAGLERNVGAVDDAIAVHVSPKPATRHITVDNAGPSREMNLDAVDGCRAAPGQLEAKKLCGDRRCGGESISDLPEVVVRQYEGSGQGHLRVNRVDRKRASAQSVVKSETIISAIGGTG